MAISGGARNCVRMWIENNELRKWDRQEMTQVAVSDIDQAVHELLKGKVVYVDLYGQLPHRVTQTVNMLLANGARLDGAADVTPASRHDDEQ